MLCSWSHSWYSRLEVDLEHHALDVRALVSQAVLDRQVRLEELRVVFQFAWVVDAGVELLPLVVIPLAAVGFEQGSAVLREDNRSLAFVDGDEANQALVPKVLQGVVMRS